MACHRGYRSWEHLRVTKMKHSLTKWFCRDELSLAMLFWEVMIALIYAWSIITFMSIWTFVLNLLDLDIHITSKKNYIEIMPTSTPHQKFLFIIYLLEDEQELSLGMLIRLQRIYNFWLLHATLSTVLGNIGLYYPLLYYFWD